MAKVRTFIAVEIAEEVRKRIAEFQEKLRQEPGRVSWSKPENIHLTLKFLGDVEETEIPKIVEAVERAVEGIAPFEVAVESSGGFPSLRRPRVLWIGCNDEDGRLKELAERVEQELAGLGYPRERRRFSPHLTIGRPKSPFIEKISQRMEQTEFVGGTMPVREVVVMKSQLHPKGAIYTPLARVALRGKR
jgi:2'-5' RNA ligase